MVQPIKLHQLMASLLKNEFSSASPRASSLQFKCANELMCMILMHVVSLDMSSSENNSFVITDVKIFTGDAFIEIGTVVIQNGQITHVYSYDKGHPTLPPGLPVTSWPGHTLIP